MLNLLKPGFLASLRNDVKMTYDKVSLSRGELSTLPVICEVEPEKMPVGCSAFEVSLA